MGKNFSPSYPVQYFACKDFDPDPKTLQGLTYLSLQKAGEIAGDTGIPGLRLDFNGGLRLQVPEGDWHVTVSDCDSGMVFYDRDLSKTILVSMEKYYIPWKIDVFLEGTLVFSHQLDLAGQKVRIEFLSPLLGDTLAFLPYIPYFQKRTHAKISYWIGHALHEVCQKLLPEIPLQENSEEDTYATYYLSAGFESPPFSPLDARMVSMMRWGKEILALPEQARPLKWPRPQRSIEQPYVCMGVQASTATKGWHFPKGWDEVVGYLKAQGYRVLCIDKNAHQENAGIVIHCPAGAEDFTGNRPLVERADMLSHADFYIGLSSGLAWLAHTVGCPVIMICGFTMDWWEFPTPYRVYNRLACHGCANDMQLTWYKKSCPRHKPGDEKYLECSKTISPHMVIQAIDRLMHDKNLPKK